MTTGSLDFKPSTVCKIMLACGVLHNMCIEANIAMDDLDVGGDDENNVDCDFQNNQYRDAHDGVSLRNRVIRGFE